MKQALVVIAVFVILVALFVLPDLKRPAQEATSYSPHTEKSEVAANSTGLQSEPTEQREESEPNYDSLAKEADAREAADEAQLLSSGRAEELTSTHVRHVDWDRNEMASRTSPRSITVLTNTRELHALSRDGSDDHPYKLTLWPVCEGALNRVYIFLFDRIDRSTTQDWYRALSNLAGAPIPVKVIVTREGQLYYFDSLWYHVGTHWYATENADLASQMVSADAVSIAVDPEHYYVFRARGLSSADIMCGEIVITAPLAKPKEAQAEHKQVPEECRQYLGQPPYAVPANCAAYAQ